MVSALDRKLRRSYYAEAIDVAAPAAPCGAGFESVLAMVAV